MTKCERCGGSVVTGSCINCGWSPSPPVLPYVPPVKEGRTVVRVRGPLTGLRTKREEKPGHVPRGRRAGEYRRCACCRKLVYVYPRKNVTNTLALCDRHSEALL